MKNLITLFALGCMTMTGVAATQQPLPATNDPYHVDAIAPSIPAPSSFGLNMKAPAAAPTVTEVIYDVEGGNTVTYSKSSAGYYLFWNTVRQYSISEAVGIIIYGDNNEVYIKNFLAKYPTYTYVKGTLDGDKITVPLPQTVLYDEDMVGLGYNLQYLVNEDVTDEEGNTKNTYVISPDKHEVTFSVKQDGSVVMDPIESDELIGFSYISNDGWTGYGDTEQTYDAINLEHPVLPAGAEVEHWGFVSAGYNYGYEIGVAIDGNDVYVQGLQRSLPNDVIKGTLSEDGTQVVFKNQQFITSLYDSYFIYLIFFDDVIYGPDKTWTMNFDRANKVMTTIEEDSNMRIAFNYYLNRLGYMSVVKNPTFKYQDNYDGTPKNPYDLSFSTEFQDVWGYAIFNACLPTVTDSEDALVIDDLYYRMFLNDEPLIFYADEYYQLPDEEIEFMPYEYSNPSDIYITPASSENPAMIEHSIGIYPDGVTTIGIQTVYMHDGETTYSDVMMLNVESGEITTIVKSVVADKEVTGVDYYDMTGKRISKPSNGMFIKRVRYNDGTISSYKQIIK